MVKKLRRKFIWVSVSTVFIVVCLIAGFIVLTNYLQLERRADEVLEIIAKNDGSFKAENSHKGNYDLPEKMSPETPFSTRYFTVKVDSEGTLISVDTGKIFSASTTEAVEYTKEVLKKGKIEGYINQFKYRAVSKEYGVLLIFIDCGRDLDMFYSVVKNSILISTVGIFSVFFLILIFSKRAIAPIAKSYEKQKQFITNASHELKTPLAIIRTNQDVLEMEYGTSEWIKSTKNQVERLSNLVGSLVSLSRMDEEKNKLSKENFSLSNVVEESAEAFEGLANQKGKEIELQIESNLIYYGNEAAIRQLVSILLENAIKYGKEDSKILLSLKQEGKKYYLQTKNEADDLVSGNYNVLFERFYRADTSHSSKTGGYGIGLSVAKAIVLKHRGKITAMSPDGKQIIFLVQLS